MTTNHPAHGPVSLDRLHQIHEILSKAAAQSDGGNLGYAMADAVKVIDGVIAALGAEPVIVVGDDGADALSYRRLIQSFAPGTKLYTAPPVQLVNTIDETLIEALRLVQCMLDDYRERNYGHAQEWIRHISAKMDDYSEQHGDDAYSVISAAMIQAGNPPATPDCWCRTCRPVTMNDMRFVVCPDCGNKRCPHANDHRNACTGSNEHGQAGSAYPAAPQQENV
ncbi:hypothetical protein [Citrobacter freundii]|uniref:hypothetical protein n=1 Tax=Citrobacter freundii TaxID=546 RepID=UPI001C895C02|nr:hypothetical protein [Citrobacter freundii]